MLAFLGKRAVAGLNRLDGSAWTQALRVAGRVGWVRITSEPERERIRLDMGASLQPAARAIERAVRRALDLDADPVSIRRALGGDAVLARSFALHPGLRVPGSLDPFDMALRAVLGQQVSVAGATTLFGRLVEVFGEDLAEPTDGIVRLPPAAERLAQASVEEIAAIGIPQARARTLRGLAEAVASGGLVLDGPRAAAREALGRLSGFGPWTMEYLAMRVLRDPDAFPVGDAGVRRALPGLSPRGIAERAEAWRPWRSYAAMHLWHLPQAAPVPAVASRSAGAAGVRPKS